MTDTEEYWRDRALLAEEKCDDLINIVECATRVITDIAPATARMLDDLLTRFTQTNLVWWAERTLQP